MSIVSLLVLFLVQSMSAATADAEVLALERVWNDAHLTGNAAALEDLWADGLVITVPRMPVLTRDDAVRIARSGRLKFQRYETSNTHARIYGDTAIVTGRLERVREREGQIATDHWQFTKVYIRQHGKWRVVAFHASDAPEVQ
jgi:hypothetical protein